MGHSTDQILYLFSEFTVYLLTKLFVYASGAKVHEYSKT